jgi:hypothetical protein
MKSTMPWSVRRFLVCLFVAIGLASCGVLTADQWIPMGSGVVNIADPGMFPGNHDQAGRVWQTQIQLNSQGQVVLWVGASHGGLWKPTLNADGFVTSYSPLTDCDPGTTHHCYSGSHTLGAFLVHPNGSKILIGTGSPWNRGGAGGSYTGEGIFRSINGGLDWSTNTLKNGGTPLKPAIISRLVGDTTQSGDYVWAATSMGLFKSIDFGANWTKYFIGSDHSKNDYLTDLLQDPSHPNVWYAGVTNLNAVYFSTDSGFSWCQLGTKFKNTKRILLAASAADDRYLYVMVVNTGKSLQAIYRMDSVNNATCSSASAWRVISQPNQNTILNKLNQGAHAAAIAVSPIDANILYFGLQKLAKSTDAASSAIHWTNDVDGGHNDYNDIRFLPNGNDVVTSNDGGIYILKSDYTLIESGNLLGINSFELTLSNEQSGLAVSHSRINTLIGGFQDNGINRAEDLNTIHHLGGGDGGQVSILPSDDSYMGFSCTGGIQGSRFVMSPYSAGTWLDTTCGIQGYSYGNVLFDTTPALPPHWEFTFGNTSLNPQDRVFFDNVNNNFCNWQPISSTNLNGTITNIDKTTDPDAQRIIVSQQSDPNVYLYYGPNDALGNLNQTTATPFHLPVIPNPDTRISADHSGLWPDTIFYTTGTGRPSRAYFLNGFGPDDLWTEVTENHPNIRSLDLIKLIANPLNQKQMFLATNNGVYRTDDGGTTWQSYSAGLRLRETVQDIVVQIHRDTDPPTVHLYIATQGRGLYTRTVQ